MMFSTCVESSDIVKTLISQHPYSSAGMKEFSFLFSVFLSDSPMLGFKSPFWE